MNVIVDLQGFKSDDNKFIPKEVAILSKYHVLVLLIKPPYPFYNLSKKERSHVTWIEKNRGILWNEGFVPYHNFHFLLQKFLKDKRCFVKGLEKVQWLKQIIENDVDVHNLEDMQCPSLETLHENYLMSTDIKSCIYHNKTCAYKNVSCLYKWCVENNK